MTDTFVSLLVVPGIRLGASAGTPRTLHVIILQEHSMRR